MNTKKYLGAFAVLAILITAGAARSADAQTMGAQGGWQAGASAQGGHMGTRMGGRMMGMKPAAVGTVTAVSGTTITLTTTGSTPTTYTVDASNAKVMKDRVASTISSVAVGDTVAVMGTTSGSNITATSVFDGMMGMGMMGRGTMGTVAAISGDTITLTAQQPSAPGSTTTSTATTTYTVDATNAKVQKDGAASSVSAIAVGDKIMVQGTTSGTSITATDIRDGMGMGGSMQAMGNGQPLIGGKVSAISGTSITVTNTAGATYTVDASNAKFTVSGVSTATIANISVGDEVLVQGAVNGSAVTATTVMDHGTATVGSGQGMNGAPQQQAHPGFFGAIGGFFKHLFGF